LEKGKEKCIRLTSVMMMTFQPTEILKILQNWYEESFRHNWASWKVDLLANSTNDRLMSGCTMEEFGTKLAEMGVDMARINPLQFAPQIETKYECRLSGVYESTLKSIVPYAVWCIWRRN
jgi:hypothetical protein